MAVETVEAELMGVGPGASGRARPFLTRIEADKLKCCSLITGEVDRVGRRLSVVT